MILRYPNARLLIYNLQACEHLSGAEAIARGAVEYGVISADGEFAQCAAIHEAFENCDCCEAAHRVLCKYFKSKTNLNSEVVEASWKSLLARLKKYKAGTSEEKPLGDEPACETVCSKLTPVIFDLMLQEVHRHS